MKNLQAFLNAKPNPSRLAKGAVRRTVTDPETGQRTIETFSKLTQATVVRPPVYNNSTRVTGEEACNVLMSYGNGQFIRVMAYKDHIEELKNIAVGSVCNVVGRISDNIQGGRLIQENAFMTLELIEVTGINEEVANRVQEELNPSYASEGSGQITA